MHTNEQKSRIQEDYGKGSPNKQKSIIPEDENEENQRNPPHKLQQTDTRTRKPEENKTGPKKEKQHKNKANKRNHQPKD